VGADAQESDETITMTTIRELRQLAPGGIVTNDRGNGSGGPGYIEELSGGETDCDDTEVTLVTRDEDPEAWDLAIDAMRALCNEDVVTAVAVGHTGGPLDSNPYQVIYAY
jgi:hypothetical protein